MIGLTRAVLRDSDNSRFAFLPLAVVASLFAVWEILSRLGSISPIVAPAPSVILTTLLAEARSGNLLFHLTATALRLMIGIIIGGSIGIFSGLVLGLSSRLRKVTDPIIAAAHPLPKIAILPIVMVIFGIGEQSKYVVIALAVFFPLVISTMTGVSQIDPLHLDVARSYGASRYKLFTRVVIPASMPMILSGFRLALNTALVATISIEVVASTRGLGALVWLSWEVLRMEVLYAALFVTALLGVFFNLITRLLIAWLAPWAPLSRST